jgi:hypothetical protein
VVCYFPTLSTFVTLFLSTQIWTVVGCPMLMICEQDRECVGCAG